MPISTGIPPIVTWSAIACVVLIFIVAGMVLSTAGFGHVWPADKSLTLPL